MSTNPLKGLSGDKPGCPADMPRGDDPASKAAREQFWIARGNAKLAEAGKYHLKWCAKDGHYWIEPR